MKKRTIIIGLAALAISGLASCGSAHTHSYDVEHPLWSWSQFSSATVTFTCSDCEETVEGHSVSVDATISEKEYDKATCVADGHKTYEASATFEGKVYTDSKTQTLPMTGHKEDESAWKSDGTNHWHNCVNCGDAYHFSTAAHSFTDWETVLEPDHYSQGSKERYCSICKYTEQEDLPMVEFTYDEVKELYNKFATFNYQSYFVSHIAEELEYALEHISEDAEAAYQSELEQWANAVKEATDYFDANFSVVIDAEGMDTYANTATSKEFYDGFGAVLKVNASSDFTGENWTFGTDRKVNFEEDIKTLVFAVYNDNPMDLMITNGDVNKFVQPVSDGIWQESRHATTCNAKAWTTFEIAVDDLADFDSVHIGLYLMGSPYGGYGIPSIVDADTNGSGYITEVVGIKSAYYETYYETKIQSATDAIEKLKSLDKSSLTLWNGGQIFEARAEVDVLPATVKKYVSNLSILEEYEAAYAEIGTAYSTRWQGGLVSPVTTFDPVFDYDETYGLYTEFNSVAFSTWVPNFSPIGNTTISGTAKVALYNPEQREVALVILGNDWSNAINAVAAPGWNEFDVPAETFNGGVASGFSIALANATMTSGYRLTGVYSAK